MFESMEQPEYEEHQDSEEAKKFIPSTEIEVGLTSESSSSYKELQIILKLSLWFCQIFFSQKNHSKSF